MRDTSNSSFQFAQGDPGNIQTVTELLRYVQDLERRVAVSMASLASGHMDVLYAAPDKPRAVLLAVADGTSWNPGSGYGLYAYNGTAWILVKAL